MAVDTSPPIRIGGTTVTIENTGSRNKAVNPALLRAVATRVEQAYGPGFTVRLKSGGGHSVSGTQRHTPIKGGGIAGDFSIETPDGRQLAGAALTPLADLWIGVEGSMGINHRPGNRGANWTHMDLVGGANPAGRPFRRGEGPVWYYGSGNYKWSEEDRTQRVIQAMGYPSVEAYQEAKGLAVDGVIGPQTNGAVLADLTGGQATSGLNVAAGPPAPDYSGDPFGVSASKDASVADPAVSQLQAFLAQNGFDPGPADGVMSEQTMAALNAYNARVDPQGAAAAASALAQSGVTNPTPQQTADAFRQATMVRQTQVASAPAPQPTPAQEAPLTPQMAYADAIDRFDTEAPAQQAVAEMAAGTGTDTLAGGTTPPTPRLRADAIADQLDEALFGAGPYRGEFARGRPEGRWTGGGAPDASAVPMPSLSPLNPAVGGPADRRPTPPMPTLRPEGRWMSGAGGAPDAGSVLTPPMRGEPNAPPRAGDLSAAMGNAAPPAFPEAYGEQPQRALADAIDRFDTEAPAVMPDATPAAPVAPRATRETWNSMGLGSRGNEYTQLSIDRPPQPPPPSPYDDWTRQYDTPGPITMANERMGVFEGTPDPSTIAPPSRTPSPMALADALMKDDAYTLPTVAPDFSAADAGPQLRISDPQAPPYLGGRQPGSADRIANLRAQPMTKGETTARVLDILGAQPGGNTAVFDPPTDESFRWFNGFSRGYTNEGGAFPETGVPDAIAATPPPSTASLVGGGPRELASDIGSYNSGLWATAPANDIISRAEGWLRSEPSASTAAIPQGDSDWSPTPTNAAMIAALDTGDTTSAAPAQTVVADALDAAATGAGQPLIGSYGVMGTTAPRIGVDIYTPPGPSGGMDIRSPAAQTLSITAPPPQAPAASSGGGMTPVTVQAPRIGGGGGGGGIFGLGANWAGPQWTGDVSSGVGPGGGQWWSGQTNAMGGTNALSWVGSDGRTITAYDNSVNGSWPQQGYSYQIGG